MGDVFVWPVSMGWPEPATGACFVLPRLNVLVVCRVVIVATCEVADCGCWKSFLDIMRFVVGCFWNRLLWWPVFLQSCSDRCSVSTEAGTMIVCVYCPLVCLFE